MPDSVWHGSNPDGLPDVYQPLYNELHGQIKTVQDLIDAGWNRSDPALTKVSCNVSTGNGGRGTELYSPDATAAKTGCRIQLLRLYNMGLRTVTFHMGYPLLTAAFHTFNGTDYALTKAFYDDVIPYAKSLGMNVIIESGILFRKVGSSNAFNVGPYYDSITYATYKAGRTQHAIDCASFYAPNILAVGSEPDNEKTIVDPDGGFLTNISTVAGNLDLYSGIISGVKAMVGYPTGMKVAAGISTWQATPLAFLDSLIQNIAGLDLVDLHHYPVNNGRFSNFLTHADYVAGYSNKRCISTQISLYKSYESELSTDIGASLALFARDPFSFWSNLDKMFYKAVIQAGRWKQMAAVSAFGSQYFFANIPWSIGASMDYATRNIQALTLASTAIVNGTYTQLGLDYGNMYNGIY